MTDLISVDAGNGMTNAVKALKRGYKAISFPSVRAQVTGDRLGVEYENAVDYVQWGEHRFAIGDDALTARRQQLERHQGAGRYGNEFHHFLVSCAIARLGVSRGDVDLTLFAPPGLYSAARDAISARFSDNGNGNVALQFSSDARARKWRFSNVNVFPEGLGAAACFALDAQGRPAKNDVLRGDCVILDLGMYTLDVLQLHNGSFNPETLASATHEAGGIKEHILTPVLRDVRAAGDDFALTTIHEIDAALRAGLEAYENTPAGQAEPPAYQLTKGRSEIDLSASFAASAERYAGWIANNVIDSELSALRGIKSLILVGGGAVLVQSYLRQWYGEKIVRFDEYDETADVSPLYANAIGGLRLAMMKKNARG